MSYLLETLGRGLLRRLTEAFRTQLPLMDDDTLARLEPRAADCPTSIDLRLRLALCYLREQRSSDARRLLEALVAESPQSKPAWLALACVYDELGLAEPADAALDEAAQQDARDPAIAFARGLIAERGGDTGAARLQYRHSADLCPGLRNAYERLAALAVRDADWTSAIEHYRMLADLEPGDLDAQLTLASLYLQSGFPEHAVDAFQRTLLIEPECSDDALETVEDLAGDGQLQQAIGAVERLVEQYPGAAELHVHLADLYVKSGADDRAVRHYRAALELHPGFVEATVKLGTQHLRAGRLAEAARAFNAAVELNDRLVTAFVGLGLAQLACTRTDEAEATLDLAASLDPNSNLLLAESARLYLRSRSAGRCALERRAEWEPEGEPGDDLLVETLRRQQRGLIVAPRRADLRYRYGLLLRQSGQPRRAIEELREAVAIDPMFTRAQLKLGLLLRQSGQADEGLRALRSALLPEPQHVKSHYQLALLFTEPARFHLALDTFQYDGPGSRSAFEHNLALALQNVGLLDRAAAAWRSLCEDSSAALRSEDRISSFCLPGSIDAGL
ncbi:MAG TPA: tetratricopeptide repeat protein [Phycisphaerae bacterium]|nr:tetratricopeptide repeat protein [Phycisphaerae bacterium]